MTMTLSVAEPDFQEAMASCVAALRRVASYELNPSLAGRMEEMGDRKEFLTPEQHDELMALVAFSQERTIEKLQAQSALNRLSAVFPGVVGTD